MADPSPELSELQRALAGRYTIERELGRGGMGIVYLARDLALERPVAIKLLPPQLATQQELRDRFLRETRTAAGLSHPNIVPIYAVEQRGDLVFYVMGYVDGETLTQRVRRAGPLPPSDAARLLQEAAWALSYAHGRGIIHRDVKPDNILIERATGRSFLTDFGIARVASAATMTAVGLTLGTPQFMSPEQAAGEHLDGRSDLYSLGVVGFFALTGAIPFDAPSVQAVLAMHLTKPAPPVASLRPGLPAKLAAVVDRCLAKEPSDRFASGEAMVNAIQAAQAPALAIAPQVRGFIRSAESLAIQVLTVALVLFALAEMRPSVGGTAMAFAGIILVVGLLQTLGRTRGLQRDGFGYADIRAAFAAEAREREELYALTMADADTRQRIRTARLMVAVAAAALLVGIALSARSPRHSVMDRVGLALASGGLLLLIFTISTRLSLDPRFTQRAQRITASLWMGPVGRGLFRLSGAHLRAVTHAALTSADGTTRSLQALLASLPAATRRTLGDAQKAIALLEQGARTLDERERELERSLLEAGQSEGLTIGGDGALGERRRALLSDLERSRARARDQRAQVAAALENIRLQLLRVRSGASAEEMRGDIATALRVASEVRA